MAELVDLGPAASRLGALVAQVDDAQLGAPTPCPSYTLGDLIDHVGGLARAFTDAAAKSFAGPAGPPPPGDASNLTDEWRTRIPRDLDALAAAWREPDAWTGMTSAGGVEMPGEVGGLVALDELVVHAWDVAAASGQPYKADDATLEPVRQFLSSFASPDAPAGPDVAFGPPATVADDAPLLDRVVALAGRDPNWSAR
jgi:uncharacterized protein (TIGR03086 family)